MELLIGARSAKRSGQAMPVGEEGEPRRRYRRPVYVSVVSCPGYGTFETSLRAATRGGGDDLEGPMRSDTIQWRCPNCGEASSQHYCP